MRITGIEDFNAAIAELTRDLKKRVVRSAWRAAAKPLVAHMKANAKTLQKPHPYRIKGLMRDRIVVTSSRIHNGRGGQIGVFVKPRRQSGVSRGAKSPLDPFYYRFIAGGFHAVGGKRVRGGRSTRKANLAAQAKAGSIRFIPGDEFIGKAFRATGSQVLQLFQTKLKARIDSANRRRK